MRQLLFVLWTVLLLGVVGCNAAPPAPTPTPTPTPQEWLARAVEAWNQTASFHFTLALANRTIALDESGALSFDEAEGDVVAPDRVRANTTIKTPLGSVIVSLIAIGDEQWLTNPLSKEWEKSPAAMQTDVTSMFDPEGGIGALLADMENLTLVGDEAIQGIETVHLRGTLPGAVLTDFAADLAQQESITVDLWIGRADNRLQRVLITEPSSADDPTTWTFQFSQYDAVPPIEPPL